MKLTYWMYSGPAHIGTLRIASSFKNVHAIMHAPLGDDYFNVMKSMLERKRDFTSITTSVVDRHVLSQGSKKKVINNIIRKDAEEKPNLTLLTPTCTSSILQEDLQNFVNKASFETNTDVLLADVNHYRLNEMQAADRTLEQIVIFYINKSRKQKTLKEKRTKTASVNIIGSFNLSFHNQHDIAELKRLFKDLKIEINLIIPENTLVSDLKILPQAWLNIVPYKETGLLTAKFLEREFAIPYIDINPIGIVETAKFIKKIAQILTENNHLVNFDDYIENQTRFMSQSAWFSRSIDCQNLVGKKAVVFGDATHAAGITKILVKEMGIKVVCAGTYCKENQNWFKKELRGICEEVLITDDHSLVKKYITKIKPEAIFGTQMERHIGKRLNIPCGIISAPIHIQNFPLSYKPFLGYEGANQIADLIYNSFTLGMEDHLLEIFGGHDTKEILEQKQVDSNNKPIWTEKAKTELLNIPRFVRRKIKIHTENFARQKGKDEITVQLMYEAKENLIEN
uniref:Light-independent protochlorophyllide reductase subunit B n=1 Tax=Chattonella marina TaxID=90936 RepID=UPI002114509B|nr:Light-independent protochlorophyllide reductase subunit B [Chattonella marina]UTE94804.1 Light-independent protochlorophyllide reductase subunit B [Chattonella marina]